MSQEINLCKGSDDFDNGEWPNTNAALVPSLPNSKERPRDKEESLNNDAHHPRNDKIPGSKAVTDSADFVVNLELADEVEVVSPHNKKRRGAMRSAKSYITAGNCLKATNNNVGSKVAHETRDDGSANKNSQKLSTLKPPPNESGRQSKVSTWDVRLSELADYRKINGHCNVPHRYSENTRLGRWVTTQRSQYRFYLEGRYSPMTNFRIQALKEIDFGWKGHGVAWEVRLSELTDFREIHGHCNVPQNYSDNTKLANWVDKQRTHYRLDVQGKTSSMTPSRIQQLDEICFEWKPSIGRGKGKPKKSSLDDDVTCVRERAMKASEHEQTTAQTQEDLKKARDIRRNQVDVALAPEESNANDQVHFGYIPYRTEEI